MKTKIKDVFKKISFTQNNIFIGVAILFSLISLILMLSVLANQGSVTRNTKHSQALIDSIQQFQGELVTYAKNTNILIKEISKNVATNQGELSKVAQAFKNDQQKVSELIKQSQVKMKDLRDKLSVGLEKQEKELSLIIEKLKSDQKEVTSTISLYSEITNGKNYKTTDNYTIYAVENYGVVIQDIRGNFILAQINKQLDIGQITAITEDFVIAGSYRIVKQPNFKVQLNTFANTYH